MCRPKPYRYKPPYILTHCPGIFFYHCHNVQYIKVEDNRYCVTCFRLIQQNFQAYGFIQFHGIYNGIFQEGNCYICGNDIITYTSVKECSTCFMHYLAICCILRERELDPNNVEELLYDCDNTEVKILLMHEPTNEMEIP